MWASAGSASGVVESFDGTVFTFMVDEHGATVSAPLAVLDSWWVSCDGGYSLGPWKAHNLPVIEDVAATRRPSQDSEGRPLCADCGRPLVEGHAYGT